MGLASDRRAEDYFRLENSFPVLNIINCMQHRVDTLFSLKITVTKDKLWQ